MIWWMFYFFYGRKCETRLTTPVRRGQSDWIGQTEGNIVYHEFFYLAKDLPTPKYKNNSRDFFELFT